MEEQKRVKATKPFCQPGERSEGKLGFVRDPDAMRRRTALGTGFQFPQGWGHLAQSPCSSPQLCQSSHSNRAPRKQCLEFFQMRLYCAMKLGLTDPSRYSSLLRMGIRAQIGPVSILYSAGCQTHTAFTGGWHRQSTITPPPPQSLLTMNLEKPLPNSS